MTLPQWEAHSKKKRTLVFLILDLIVFTTLLAVASLRVLGVLTGSAPSPILWVLLLAGLASSLYGWYRFLKHPRQGSSNENPQ